ncbi:hypothetical protein [Pyxidicoccus sp. MSG2]|uniref:hypothetical protein n=1 Tax=Pyxidicoccus sp. MSG2 TaxID=2996790 RepID=UPI002271AF9C|nr:hypothetical protein [Pyxidicoccus sp. MSG2]MCY1023971.1 hypothetical protein [Pyxidicoccus sp. MSG2]
MPNPQGTACVRVGGACGGVSQYGYCAGDTWVRCDAGALVAIGCGAGQCRTVDAQGTGACTCGSIDDNGVCAGADGTSVARPRTHFMCARSLGILVADNCAARTGSPNGFCSTLVTAFGSQTTCFCDTCTYPGGSSNQCVSACARPSDCRYYSAGNYHTCGF